MSTFDPSSSQSANSDSSSGAREILDSCLIISQRLRDALSCPGLLLLHLSQWRCLASSYFAVLEALSAMLEHACSDLEPSERESMCRKLIRPLRALHQAVQEGETCMQESLPSSYTSKHSWLLEKALKQGMSTEVVDLHLYHLLWTSSVVREQILRCAPIQGIRLDVLISEHTKHLCEIWSHVDKENDLLAARSLLTGIVAEEEGDTRQLANFILQRLSCPELSIGCITDSKDLPPFLWVDSKDVKREPEIIGGGSFAHVQEAVWLGGRFAVKEFHSVENVRDFGREATIQAKLHHPNVMSLVCCSTTSGPLQLKCSLVMERMQGDLHALLLRRKQAFGMEIPFHDLVLAMDFMLQVAQGMEYLHSDNLRVIHRDIKSNNILVSLSNRSHGINDANPPVHLKVADFGMSKMKYTSSKFTTRQRGATAWRAPEVFDIDPGDELLEERSRPHPSARYTNKADVYSFGMVCYEILAGEAPFEGLKLAEVRRKVLSGERPSLPRHCPPALSSYIQRCWHAVPEERPTFTQICRMFRYFKACCFMGDHGHDQNAAECNNWLLYPLPTSVCTCIDDMLHNLAARQLGGLNLRPGLLVIPLEMYCCRVVLQQIRYESDTTDGFNSPGSRREGTHELAVTEDQASVQEEIALDVDSMNFHEGESSSMRPDDPRQPGKGYLYRAWKWFQKLPHAHHVKAKQVKSKKLRSQRAEFRSSLGLVGDFSYEELCKATKNFSDAIGEGGTGHVYRGQLMNGQTIAVKVHHKDGMFAWETITQELVIASQLRHRNIVPLLGWCLEKRDNLLLVYEYMPNGDVAKHILAKVGHRDVLGWQQRYKIVGQLAAALKYLHQDSGYREIVHRDVQPLNIMLDSEWNARLGDCGLAVLLEERQNSSWDSLDVWIVGTPGYTAPEVILTGNLTPASDVFSFGVTALNIATGLIAYDHNRHPENCHIYDWVWGLYCKGEVMRAADVQLQGNFDESEMKRLLVLGLSCTNQDPMARPTMEDVLRILSTGSDPPLPQARVLSPPPVWSFSSDVSD